MSRLDESRTAASNDTYETPGIVLARVRYVFGGDIGLDPCANERNNARALKTYTEAENGLAQAWGGRVFVNPPYGRALLSWMTHVVNEAPRCEAIITLTPARPDTRWYDLLVSNATCYAEIRGRLTFELGGVPADAPCQFPCTLALFTQDLDTRARFEQVMRHEYFARLAQVLR